MSEQGQEPEKGQEPNAPSGGEPSGSRSIDGFPSEAQDYIRRLREEAAKYRNEVKEVRTSLKEFEDRDKSDAQKLNDRVEAAERSAAEAAVRLARYEVAAEMGLPLKLAARLQGSTAEELKADAEALKKEFGLDENGSGTSAGRSGFDGGVRRPVQRPKSMNGLIKAAAGR